MSIYRIKSLKDAKKKFKIEMNSKQLYMSGVTILNPECSVVIVEGGPKAQRKFRRLMQNRIKWEEDTLEYEDVSFYRFLRNRFSGDVIMLKKVQ